MRSFSFSLLSLTCLVLIQLLCSLPAQVQGKAVLPALPSPSQAIDGSASFSVPTVAPSQALVEKKRRKEARKEAKRHAAAVAAGRAPASAPPAAAPAPASAPAAGRRRALSFGKRDSNPAIHKARDGLVPLQHLPRQAEAQQPRGEQKKKRACTTSEKKKRALKREKRAAKASAKAKRALVRRAAVEPSEEKRYAPDPADHPLN